jgi:hypothetical protein
MNDLIEVKSEEHADFLIRNAERLERRARDYEIIAGTDPARYTPSMEAAGKLQVLADRDRASVKAWLAAKQPVVTSKKLIALLDDPRVAAAVNEKGGGRHS